MATLLRSSWSTSRPPAGSTVNWGHPLAQDLYACFLINEYGGLNLHNLGRIATPPARITSGTTTWRPEGLSLDTQNSAYATWTAPTETISSGTLLVRFIHTSNVVLNSYAGLLMGRSTGRFGMHLAGATADNVLSYTWPDDGSDYNWNSGVVVPQNVLTTTAVSIQPAYVTAFCNGTTAAKVNTAAAQSFGGAVYIGADAFNLTSRCTAGFYHAAMMWTRALRVDELDWLYAEPYAFITPPGPKISIFDLAPGAAAADPTVRPPPQLNVWRM